MNVLVVGRAGYLGCVLTPILLEKGHTVTILDRFYYGLDPVLSMWMGLPDSLKENLTILRADMRWPDLGEGPYDSIVLAASLSNDPLCDLDTKLTYNINVSGTQTVLEGIKNKFPKARVIFISSASVYGINDKDILDEKSPLDPLTHYAKSKLMIEADLNDIKSKSLDWIILRPATLFGYSPRMRLDLAINTMTLAAVKQHRIRIDGTGKQWRPFVHVSDLSQAIAESIVGPSTLSHQTYNIVNNSLTCQIRNLAYKICNFIPNVEIYEVPVMDDPRSYRVVSDKFSKASGFEPTIGLETGIREIQKFIEDGNDTEDTRWRSLQWYKNLSKFSKALTECQCRPLDPLYEFPKEVEKLSFKDV